MTPNFRWIRIATFVLVLSGSELAAQQRPRELRPGRHPAAYQMELRHPMVHRLRGHGSELRRFLDRLELTKEQREVALSAAREARPIAQEARREAARIRAAARPGERRVERRGEQRADRDDAGTRETRREQTKELRARTLGRLRPLAERVLATLTPEQREKLGGQREKLGGPDEERLTKVVSWLLTSPRTAAVRGRRSGR